MYLRPDHAEHDVPSLHAFIRANPLGIFTTAIESPSHAFLQSSHIPWVLDAADDGSTGKLGKLRGHIARANPQAKAIVETLTSGGGRAPGGAGNTLNKDVLLLFNAPTHHYVTPKFYRETKPATGKVVPTWDYAAVQVYGRATIYYDPKSEETSAFLSRVLDDLTKYAEEDLMGHEKPWRVSDAPSSYTDLLKKAILGIEIEITNIGGRFKMSQEMRGGDRLGVIEGFESLGTLEGQKMAQMVKARAELADAKKTGAAPPADGA
ncbi:hypothetical protein BV20DRAFT_302526 [Pilatotrama ljubarskyi]|nr:hypothetical protein BV20DRAFT_302526 [Pilatotrama ljubarskyi]